MEISREYAKAATIYFYLVQDRRVDYATDAEYTPVAGDVMIVKDGGPAVAATNLPVHISKGHWKLDLTQSEMTANVIAVMFIDSAPKVTSDRTVLIATYAPVV